MPGTFHLQDEVDKGIGLICIRVDDDLIAGPLEFFKNQVAAPKKLRCYGKWHSAEGVFHHCGR